MKSTGFSTVVLAALLGTGVAQSSMAPSAAQPPKPNLSRQEAERLVYSATTPEQHRQLAEYYRRESTRQKKKEQDYLGTEASYRQHPPRADSYRNTPTYALYSELAENAHQLAFADEQLARYQEQLARELESSK